MELVEIAVQRARVTSVCISLTSIVFHVQVPPKSQLERAILSHLTGLAACQTSGSSDQQKRPPRWAACTESDTPIV
jgi:hypothetical protein